MPNIIDVKPHIKQDEIIQVIKDLISIPSYPGIENQETNVALYLHMLFENEGIESEIVHVVDGRCNIIAKLKGLGKGKNLLLVGHTDTVPAYDMKDACVPYIMDGKIFGRGSVDMKGPLACMVLSMIAIKRSGVVLDGDVIFAGVIDEELKSEGTIDLIKRGIVADAAIVGEPTNLDICVAHRGLEWLEISFKGETVHGGRQSKGVNAINMAVAFINHVNEKLPLYIEKTSHEIIGKGSFNFGKIYGGSQPSSVAGDCCVKLDRRWLPGEKHEEIIEQFNIMARDLSESIDNFQCDIKVMDESLMRDGFVHEAMDINLDHEIVKITSEAVKDVLVSEPEKTFFSAWSDGGLLSSYAKIPTIIFAPGDIETAHSPIEHINISQLYPAVLIYANIICKYCNIIDRKTP